MRYDRLDLNLLVALDALLTEQSVSGAAARLHRSQPATSAALARLREYFKDDLLVAAGRRMRPTVRGEQLLEPIRRLLTQLEATVLSPPQFEPETCSRRFIIEASDYVSDILLRSVVDDVLTQAPGVTLHITQREDPASPEPSLADLVIAPEEFPAPDYEKTALFADDFVVVGWEANPALASPMSTEQFFALEHVGVAFGRSRFSSFPDAALSRLRHARNVVLYVPSFTSVCAFLLGTPRVAVMHRLLAIRMASVWPLAMAELPVTIPPFREALLHKADRGCDVGLMWLKQIILRHAAALPAPRRRKRARANGANVATAVARTTPP
jgi:LysR family nod box-dependent transcriptional activator